MTSCSHVVEKEQNEHGDDGTGNVVTMLEHKSADPSAVQKGLSDEEGMLTTKLRVLTNYGTCTRSVGCDDGCVILTCKDMLTHSYENRRIGT